MPKIHYFQRYSTVENAVTNNTLQLFARIYSYSTTQASKLLTELTGEPIEIGVEINQQGRAQESVPDGAIVQRSFKILVESKVDSPVREDQLIRHAAGFANEAQKILLLLTREKLASEQERAISKKIAARHAGVIFKSVSYEDICNAVGALFRDYEFDMRALIDDYIEYCNDANLSDQSKYLMRIVPCGSSIELNRKYGVYFQPTDRGCTKHSFVGIYSGKRVQYMWAIDSVFDVHISGKTLKKTLVQGRETDDHDKNILAIVRESKIECGYEVEEGHRFFYGREVLGTDFVKKSAGGIMGARLINLKTILGQFSDAKDVAKQLSGKQWE